MMQVSKDIGGILDRAAAAWAAVWFRSAARWEVERLAGEGLASGTTCDVGFSVACEDAGRDDTARALRAAGFTVLPDTAASSFLTVSLPIALRPYDLALALAAVNRVARRHGGYAELIGPLGTPAPAAAPAAPSRAPILEPRSA